MALLIEIQLKHSIMVFDCPFANLNLLASNFFDILEQFGEVDEEVM